MRIEKIAIKNYRRFEDFTVEFGEDNLIVLAGANNTGKTSFVLLLKSLFNNSRSITHLDISMDIKNQYTNELLSYLSKKNPSESSELINNLMIYMNKKDSYIEEEFISNKNVNYPITVQLTVGYEEDEPIGNFANYLMDLDEDNQHFYFEFSVEVNYSTLRAHLDELKDELFHKYQLYVESGEANKTNERYNFENSLFSAINEHLENRYYYADKTFLQKNEIDGKQVKELFNFQYISASRKLDDEEVKDKRITNSIIDINNPLKDGSTWKDKFKDFYKEIEKAFLQHNIADIIKTSTSDELSIVKKSLDDISENEIEELEAILSLEEKNILNLIKSDISVNYTYETGKGKMILGEESQGLGISNLIYITLEIQKFLKESDTLKNKVNIFVLEEPENHMHVQMQKVFISYLMDVFASTTPVQSIVTTHSTEIVKESNLDYIKVIRSKSPFKNCLVDLKQFIVNHEENRNFYETLFKLNFSNIIFADYAILFEGDTERMYLESLITRNSEYDSLAKRFIAYCQIGGAYAHKYFPLIEELQVKTCVFTDIDYPKQFNGQLLNDLNNALLSKSSNYTLTNILKDGTDNEKEYTIQEIIDEIDDDSYYNNKYYRVYTQMDDDGYGRTLEDTMLFQYIKKQQNTYNLQIEDVFTEISKDNWKNIRNGSKFIFSKPIVEKASIRYVADKIDKSNFMYSVILNDENDDCLPNYIKEGLKWLQE